MIALDTNVLVRFLTQDEPGPGAGRNRLDLRSDLTQELCLKHMNFLGRVCMVNLDRNWVCRILTQFESR